MTVMKIKRNITIVIVLISFCFQLTSCSSLSFKRQCSYDVCFSIRVPQGCSLAWDWEGEGEEEVAYMREDSAFIYVSSSWYSPNESNIRTLDDSIVELRFQRNELYADMNNMLGYDKYPICPDTVELSGVDAKGLYWKDILYRHPVDVYRMHSMGVSIGYYNVPKADKELFDKALSTFVNKRKYE